MNTYLNKNPKLGLVMVSIICYTVYKSVETIVNGFAPKDRGKNILKPEEVKKD